MLSCATVSGIQTSDVAELHYGDREEEIAQKLGQGREVLYFILSGEQYRYRLYSTVYLDDVYALLFRNGELLAVHDKKQDFSNCLNIGASQVWEQCLFDDLSEMRHQEISLDSYDFSHKSDAEHEEQARVDRKRAGTAAIGVPLVVVYPWYVATACFFSCGECLPDLSGERGDYQDPCMKTMSNAVSLAVDSINNVATRDSIERTTEVLNLDNNLYASGRFETSNQNDVMLRYSWGCVYHGSHKYLSIIVGLSEGRLKWAWFRY